MMELLKVLRETDLLHPRRREMRQQLLPVQHRVPINVYAIQHRYRIQILRVIVMKK